MKPCNNCDSAVYRSSQYCIRCYADATWHLLYGIDWSVLREQKSALLDRADVIDHNGGPGAESIDGVIHFLSRVQDYAVDAVGLDESEVYGVED